MRKMVVFVLFWGEILHFLKNGVLTKVGCGVRM